MSAVAVMKSAVAAVKSAVTSPFPPSIDEHPLVLKHSCQRRELSDALDAARAEHDRLTAERAQCVREGFEREVAEVLGDKAAGPAAPEAPSRLAELDAALARAQARMTVITAAAERLEMIAEGARTKAAAELREQALAAAREVVSEMLPKVEALEQLNEKLLALTERCGGYGSTPTVFRPTVLSTSGWLQLARVFVEQGR